MRFNQRQRVDMYTDNNFGSRSFYYQNIYGKMIGNEATGLLNLLWRYPHKLMEKKFKSNQGLKILEVGYGKGEHFSFVAKDFARYTAIDINPSAPDPMFLEKRNVFEYQSMNAEDLKFSSNHFDRLIATCLIVHLNDPEKALMEWRRVLKPGAVASIYLALEPSLALRIFRVILTSRKAKKLGFDGYKLFIARDHINYASGVMELIREVFKGDSVSKRYRPFPVPFWYINLFCIVDIKVNPVKDT
jgi:phosphatidylethanolamine/phosphatidyl-N-methylethanolamine N-methyltransferase